MIFATCSIIEMDDFVVTSTKLPGEKITFNVGYNAWVIERDDGKRAIFYGLKHNLSAAGERTCKDDLMPEELYVRREVRIRTTRRKEKETGRESGKEREKKTGEKVNGQTV